MSHIELPGHFFDLIGWKWSAVYKCVAVEVLNVWIHEPKPKSNLSGVCHEIAVVMTTQAKLDGCYCCRRRRPWPVCMLWPILPRAGLWKCKCKAMKAWCETSLAGGWSVTSVFRQGKGTGLSQIVPRKKIYSWSTYLYETLTMAHL